MTSMTGFDGSLSTFDGIPGATGWLQYRRGQTKPPGAKYSQGCHTVSSLTRWLDHP